MATTAFTVTVGYGIDESVAVSGTVETTPPGLSGLYVRLFAPADTQTGNPLLVQAQSVAVPLRVERRYELPPRSPLRVEVDATAGGSGAPMSAEAQSSSGQRAEATGYSNESLVLTLAAP